MDSNQCLGTTMPIYNNGYDSVLIAISACVFTLQQYNSYLSMYFDVVQYSILQMSVFFHMWFATFSSKWFSKGGVEFSRTILVALRTFAVLVTGHLVARCCTTFSLILVTFCCAKGIWKFLTRLFTFFLENDLFRVEEAVKTDLQIVRYLDEGSDEFLEVLADFCFTCLEIGAIFVFAVGFQN